MMIFKKIKHNPLIMVVATYLLLCVYAPFHKVSVQGETITLSSWFDHSVSDSNPVYRFMELPNILAIDLVGRAIGDKQALNDHLKNISTSDKNT